MSDHEYFDTDELANWEGREDRSLLDFADVMKLEELTWLIDGLIPFPSTTVLYGPTKHGKSFIALAWAASIALGRPWMGHAITNPGPVLYIAGEGGRGVKKRIRAIQRDWKLRSIPGLYFRIKPLDVHDEESVNDLIETIQAFDIVPRFLVIDTLATCFSGRDENNTADMAEFVKKLTELSNEMGIAVLIVHHTGRNTSHERGSTALKSGVDTQFKAEATLDPKNRIESIELSCEKQKDGSEADPIRLVPRFVGEGNFGSLVLDQATENAATSPETELQGAQKDLSLLREFAIDGQLSVLDWANACMEKGISRATHFRHRKTLQASGIIEIDKGSVYLLG